MDEIHLDTIKWTAIEYNHEEKSNDWYWAIGLITLIATALAIWFHNYVFAIFLFISGCSLILFSFRHPEEVEYTIETKGLSMGRELHTWKSIKSFNIKNQEENDNYAKLMIETSKHMLPIYTIPLPDEKVQIVKDNLLKVIPRSEIKESQTMLIMEKLGF